MCIERTVNQFCWQHNTIIISQVCLLPVTNIPLLSINSFGTHHRFMCKLLFLLLVKRQLLNSAITNIMTRTDTFLSLVETLYFPYLSLVSVYPRSLWFPVVSAPSLGNENTGGGVARVTIKAPFPFQFHHWSLGGNQMWVTVIDVWRDTVFVSSTISSEALLSLLAVNWWSVMWRCEDYSWSGML